jgi:uncharacterized protein YdhG (YjbR/CyaY superfamily)
MRTKEKKPRMKMSKAANTDEYLARVNEEHRAALGKLRKIIKSVAPQAEECISYGMPAFRLNGLLVGFSSTLKHCAFYPMGGGAVKEFQNELKDFDTSKGTIRFQPEKPLPVALVKKIVKARMAQNAARKKG